MLLSCLFRTYNEEKWLPKVLPIMLSFSDEVVIADGGSTDGTRAIADEYENVTWVDASEAIFSVNPHLNHAGRQLNAGLAHCRGDWVYTQDVDLLPCVRFHKHIREILETTTHDAFLMYAVHLVGDENHYAGEHSLGPGVVQLFRNKQGVHFPDQPEHAHLIMDFNWDSLGILRCGQFHYGYVDRDWELEKIASRSIALKDDTAYNHLATHPPQHTPKLVLWNMCDSDCEVCWMERIAAGHMLTEGVKIQREIEEAVKFHFENIAAATLLNDREMIEMQTQRYEELVENLARQNLRVRAMRERGWHV
jgi:glycosyltransferase involved in cell wall biosynthesis